MLPPDRSLAEEIHDAIAVDARLAAFLVAVARTGDEYPDDVEIEARRREARLAQQHHRRGCKRRVEAPAALVAAQRVRDFDGRERVERIGEAGVASELEAVRDPLLDLRSRVREHLEVAVVVGMHEHLERDAVDLGREALELRGHQRDLGHGGLRRETERRAVAGRAHRLPLARTGREPCRRQLDVERDAEIVGAPRARVVAADIRARGRQPADTGTSAT